ncbi:MAG: hypothetical protein Q4B26_06710 [Eubacteriales bacterium]|nr:hypothetical protein [Eubacteriales bacterium]
MENSKEIRTNEIEAAVKNILSETLTKDENGYFDYEIYADYRDEISNEALIKIFNSETPEEAFYEYISDVYLYYEEDAREEIFIDLLDQLREKMTLTEEEEEYVSDLFRNLVVIDLPYNHFLDQRVRTDIFVDTGDANYDFTLNHFYPSPYGNKEMEISEKASLRWLAATQGYSEKQLRKALEEENEADCESDGSFLESVVVELANTFSDINALVFLAEMSVRELLALNQKIQSQYHDGVRSYDACARSDAGEIKISKKADCGLFNSFDGSGGPFEIFLEKDVILPVKFIHSALPDGGEGRWSVEKTYGMCGSAWKDVVQSA